MGLSFFTVLFNPMQLTVSGITSSPGGLSTPFTAGTSSYNLYTAYSYVNMVASTQVIPNGLAYAQFTVSSNVTMNMANVSLTSSYSTVNIAPVIQGIDCKLVDASPSDSVSVYAQQGTTSIHHCRAP
jgi:hypothetical protein